MERISELLAEKGQFRIGNMKIVEEMPETPAGIPFDKERIDFLNQVSRELLADKEARAYSDIVTFAFWIRKTNMEKEKKDFFSEGMIRMGRGIVFHIAPSNVAVNYAYSFAIGFVLGNANIVRLPSKEFVQVDIINRGIQKVLDKPEYRKWKNYLVFLQYEKNKEINDYFSSICDMRIIWGGDQTIKEIRKSELPPRAGEITFADRYSICVIDAEMYLGIEDKDMTALNFYNDTYLTDQNACTSPRLVCWMGEKKMIRQAKSLFWEKLWSVVEERYLFQPVQYINKLTECCMVAAAVDGTHVVKMKDGRIVRVEVEKIDSVIQKYQGNSGFFYEYELEDIKELVPICSEKLQTVVMLGRSKEIIALVRLGIKGIDRIVELGKSMEFGFVWDGMDLRERLTRVSCSV